MPPQYTHKDIQKISDTKWLISLDQGDYLGFSNRNQCGVVKHALISSMATHDFTDRGLVLYYSD